MMWKLFSSCLSVLKLPSSFKVNTSFTKCFNDSRDLLYRQKELYKPLKMNLKTDPQILKILQINIITTTKEKRSLVFGSLIKLIQICFNTRYYADFCLLKFGLNHAVRVFISLLIHAEEKRQKIKNITNSSCYNIKFCI